MSKLDLALVEPYNRMHYYDVPIFLGKLLSRSDLRIGFIDYLNQYNNNPFCINLSPENITLPDNIISDKIYHKLKKFLKFRKFQTNLLKYTTKYTDNIIFTTYTPFYSTKFQKKKSFILYIHDSFVINPSKEDSFKKLFFKKYMTNKILKNTVALITNEEKIQDKIEKIGVKKPIYIIPWLSNIHLDTIINNKIIMKKDFPEKNRFLYIGEIRKEKKIEFIIDNIANTDINLTIAGKPIQLYGKKIEEKYKRNKIKNIDFVFRFLSGKEYLQKIHNHSFVLISREKIKGFHSSGPMLDSLLCGRPFIAPDYFPFNYYVKKYNVGLLYEPENNKSFIKTIKRAKDLGPKYFEKNITNFVKKRYDFNKLSEKMEYIVRKHFNI